MIQSAIYKHSKRDTIIEFFLFVLYKFLFELLAIVYNDLPIYDRDVNVVKNNVIIGWIVYVLFVICIQKFLKDEFYKVSYKYLFVIAGMTTILCFEIFDYPIENFIKAVTYWFLLLVFFALNQNKTYKFKVNFKQRKNIIEGLFFFCAFFALLMSGIYAGFRITLSFDDVYEYRMAMRAESMPTIIKYLFFFVSGTILPLCFAYFCSKKDYIKIILSGFFAILLFSINGMKTWLIIYGLIISIYLSFKFNRRLIISYILIGLILFTVIAGFTLSRGEYLATGLLDRIILIPSRIGYNYISFFDEHEFLFLRESILKFIGSPYPVPSSFYIVAGDATTETTSRANNGLWGDAYANFAFAGILIYPFLMGIVMKMLKSSLSGLDMRFVISLSFILLWSSINSSFFTWLLSDGVIITILLSRMMKKANNVQVAIS